MDIGVGSGGGGGAGGRLAPQVSSFKLGGA